MSDTERTLPDEFYWCDLHGWKTVSCALGGCSVADTRPVKVVRTATYQGTVDALSGLYDVALKMWADAEDQAAARDALVKAAEALGVDPTKSGEQRDA